MVEMIVQGIRKCTRNGQTVLFLKEKAGERVVPVGLPQKDSEILVSAFDAEDRSRPDVYSFLSAVLSHLGGEMVAIVLHVGIDKELGACVRLDSEKGSRQIDVGPFDALAIALRLDCPMFMTVETVDAVGFTRQGHDWLDCRNGEVKGQAKREGGSRDDLPSTFREFLATLDLSGLGDA